MTNNGTYLPCPVVLNGVGAGQDASSFGNKTVFIWGTFTATYQIQISPDGITWFNEGSTVAGTGATTSSTLVTKPCLQMRIQCTAFTSGSATAVCYGNTNSVKG